MKVSLHNFAIQLPLATLIFFSTVGNAQEAIYRPATPNDTPGIWQQVSVQTRNPDMDLSNPWFSAEQYFWFLPNNGLKVMVIEKANAGKGGITSDDIAIWEAAPTTMRIEWGPEGRAFIHHPESGPSPVLITYYREDLKLPEGNHPIPREELPRKGDISITYVDRQTYTPLFFRLLRPYPDSN